jgi:hypothetical protein
MHYPLLIAILLALFSGTALAEADGPDYYQLRVYYTCGKTDLTTVFYNKQTRRQSC